MAKARQPQKRRKSRAKQLSSAEQTPTVRPVGRNAKEKPNPKRGLKLPSADLAELLWLANLAPADYEFSELLGETDDLKDAEYKLETLLSVDNSVDPMPKNSPEGEVLGSLKNSLLPRLLDSLRSKPDALRAHLLDHMHRPKEWRPISLEEEPQNHVAREYAQVVAALMRHNQIWDARYILRTLIRGNMPYIPVSRSVTSLFVDEKGTVQERVASAPYDDIFSRATKGIAVSYLRECPICGRFFFARRSTSVVCEPDSKCAATHAKREERKNAKERRRLQELAKKNAAKKKERKNR